jgi:glycogen operon protein
MILMGDEVRRTQNGTNNAYCHDNEENWFDWRLLSKHPDVHRFVSLLSARRATRSAEHEHKRTTLNQLIQEANKSWHGVRLDQPDWGDTSHSIAFSIELRPEKTLIHMIFNAYSQPLDFELPRECHGRRISWRRWIDTFLDSPHDIVDWQDAPAAQGPTYHVEPRSVVVLFAPLERQ